jgi:hypothetical protein
MPNLRLIALNAAGGAQVSVLATRWTRRVEIIEDEATTPQGLIYQVPDDAFVGTYQVGPATEPLILENPTAQGRGAGPIQGAPAQGFTGAPAATTLFKATSATAAATNIRFRETD